MSSVGYREVHESDTNDDDTESMTTTTVFHFFIKMMILFFGLVVFAIGLKRTLTQKRVSSLLSQQSRSLQESDRSPGCQYPPWNDFETQEYIKYDTYNLYIALGGTLIFIVLVFTEFYFYKRRNHTLLGYVLCNLLSSIIVLFLVVFYVIFILSFMVGSIINVDCLRHAKGSKMRTLRNINIGIMTISIPMCTVSAIYCGGSFFRIYYDLQDLHYLFVRRRYTVVHADEENNVEMHERPRLAVRRPILRRNTTQRDDGSQTDDQLRMDDDGLGFPDDQTVVTS